MILWISHRASLHLFWSLHGSRTEQENKTCPATNTSLAARLQSFQMCSCCPFHIDYIYIEIAISYHLASHPSLFCPYLGGLTVPVEVQAGCLTGSARIRVRRIRPLRGLSAIARRSQDRSRRLRDVVGAVPRPVWQSAQRRTSGEVG